MKNLPNGLGGVHGNESLILFAGDCLEMRALTLDILDTLDTLDCLERIVPW